MRYADGQEARLGDKVLLGGVEGVVVCSIDTEEYLPGESRHWAHMDRGVMVRFQRFGLIHFKDTAPGLELLERSATGLVR